MPKARERERAGRLRSILARLLVVALLVVVLAVSAAWPAIAGKAGSSPAQRIAVPPALADVREDFCDREITEKGPR
jgi:hypothetical protein